VSLILVFCLAVVFIIGRVVFVLFMVDCFRSGPRALVDLAVFVKDYCFGKHILCQLV
jgi:hypothetical protein